MRIKRKIELKSVIPKPVCFTGLVRYQTERKKNESHAFLNQQYVNLFNEEPPENIHSEFISLRIEYELMMRDYQVSGITEIPEKIKQNYEASKQFNLKGLTEMTKNIISAKIKTQPESSKKEITKNGKKEIVQVSKKETVTQSYIRLFDNNHTKKWTDDQLAAEMRKLYPDKKKYAVKDIQLVRNMYNRGRLVGQKGKPMNQLETVK